MANVCSIDYIGRNYPANKASEVAKLHMQVENDFRSMGQGIIEANTKINKFVPTSYKLTQRTIDARNVMKRINNYYEAPVIEKGRDTLGRDFYTVNVAKAFEIRELRNKQALEKIQADPFIVVDGEIMNPDDALYNRKAVNLESTPLDTLEGFFKKAEHMQNIFNSKGVDVYVMLDGDQITPGQVLGSNNATSISLRQQGIIGENTKVISVNPNMLYNDVILHEFSHLFIDLIGGMNNSRVLAAYNKLAGTEVYNRVSELYGELDKDSDTFKKEVVATAMGVVGDEVFNNDTDKNWWQRFLDWIGGRMQTLLGIRDKDIVRSLMQDMLRGEFNVSGTISSDNYFRKQSNIKLNNRIQSLEEANKNIGLNIQRMVRTFESRTGTTIIEINPTEDYQAFQKGRNNKRMSQQAFILGKMKTINEAIGRLSDGHSEHTMISYVNVAVEGIQRNLNQLKSIEADLTNDDYDLDKGMKFLESIQISNESFDILEKINAGLDKFETTAEVKSELKSTINKALAMKNDTHNKFMDVSKQILVKRLLPMEEFILAERKEQLEVEYNSTKDSATSRVIADESKEEFVNRMLSTMKDDIAQETATFIEQELTESITDIGQLEFFVRSEKSINSMVIRLASRIMDRAAYNADKAFLEKRADVHPIFEEYAKKHKSTDQKKMWSAITQEVDGEVYLKSKYDINFMKQWQEAREKFNSVQNDTTKTTEEYAASRREFNKWLDENTSLVFDPVEEIDVRIPKDKWLNKDYSVIKSNPNSVEAKMLSLLEKTIGESDRNYNGRLKLGRAPFGNIIQESAVFFRMPAMGKDTLEKVVGGDYLANAKDTLERLYKFKEDDPERFGEVVEESETTDNFNGKIMKKVLGDTQGHEKHNIPIYYRGKFDPQTSTRDLMTAVMSDYYMSLQFKEKTEVLPLLEILTTVTENKAYGESSGLKNLNKVFRISDTEYNAVTQQNKNSLEYQKLKSIIENRMYNITTLESEAGKIAQTVMAWTGSVMMSLNFFSGIANVMQGKVMNWLESVGGNFYDSKDLAIGEKKFFADMGAWMDDLGTVNNNSKTRLMIDLMNVQGNFIGLKERYIRSNRGLALASRKTLTAPNTMGEFYVQSTLMYSIMNRIKVKDKDGNYIDKNLKPTKDASKAISLDEAITVKDGKLVVDDIVHSTTFSPNANGNKNTILEETRALIKKVSSDLHGQYDKELQAHAQRSIWGKFPFMFRKWLVPGFDRRWRGTANVVSFKKEGWQTFEDLRDIDNRKNRFFSGDLKQFQEGTYTTFIRMISQLVKEGDIMKLATISKTNTWNQMTDTEKANVKKAAMEYATIALTLAAAYVLRGLAADLPEDDPAYTGLMLSAFAARRLHMELFAYSNPLEALTLMRSPAASISLFEKSGKLMVQLLSDTTGYVFSGENFDTYDRGELKGMYKIQKYSMDLLPVLNQTNRTVEDVTTFVFQNY